MDCHSCLIRYNILTWVQDRRSKRADAIYIFWIRRLINVVVSEFYYNVIEWKQEWW